MFHRFIGRFVFLVLSGLLLHGTAAGAVLFVGSGIWSNDAQSSSFSAAGAGWSFAFTLPDTIAANPTPSFSGFSYALNGTAVDIAPVAVEFFNSADSGMFDLVFGSAGTLSLYGPPVVEAAAFRLGTYEVFSGSAGGVPTGGGSVTLQAVSAIPEPGTWATVAVGLAGLGFVARRRRGAGRRAA